MLSAGTPIASRHLTLEIGKTGDREEGKPYVVGQRIGIRCKLKNAGSRPVTVVLRDHDPYLGTLRYADNLMVSVQDTAGRVITKCDMNKDGWWTSFALMNQFPVEEPGDRLTIPPGKHVTRVIDLDDVLGGCPCLAGRLPVGRFVVQVRIDDVISNQLALEVAAE
jgi:small nuclear ribonucleoprotein (snRNP)-like protein